MIDEIFIGVQKGAQMRSKIIFKSNDNVFIIMEKQLIYFFRNVLAVYDADSAQDIFSEYV